MVCEKIRSEATTTKEKEIKQKSQKEEDKIKIKLHKANKDWNDWKFQIKWNKLEWVNPRSLDEQKNILCVLLKICFKDNIKTTHWVGH